MDTQYREETFLTFDGARLFERGWVPESCGAVVGLLHGSFEHSGRYARIASFLADRGYAVYAMDLRGHGKSDGKRIGVGSFETYGRDLAMFIDRIRVVYPEKPLFLLAHSMGASIVLSFVLERKEPVVNGIVLSAPVVVIGQGVPVWIKKLYPALERLFPGLRLQGPASALLSRDRAVLSAYHSDPLVEKSGMPVRAFGEFMRSVEALRGRVTQVDIPFLLLHGTDDRLADAQASRELYAKARTLDKTLKLYDKFYHEVLNEPGNGQVLEDIASWLDARRTN